MSSKRSPERDDWNKLQNYFSPAYLDFLQDLHYRLTIPSNDGAEIFTHSKMKEEELERILNETFSYSEARKHSLFLPYRACNDFFLGFKLYLLPERRKNINKDRKFLFLRFIENQLPDGYDFHALKPYFLDDMNRACAKEYLSDPLIRADRNYYDSRHQYKKR